MREGWEIRKLGDVCTRITDGSHNPPKGIAHSDFAMISSQNVYNDKISFDDVRYLQEEDFNNEDKRTSVRNGDVLLTIVGTVGRCAVFSVDRHITLQRSVAVLRPQNCLKPRFLMHCLISKSAWLNEEAHGIAQKGLYLKQLAKVSIPVPPIAEQEKIVAELDCLSGIIEKKKQQLEELDKQSIFYDMFGDPITNEKGWEVKKLGDVCAIERGGSPRPITAYITDAPDGINWIKIGDAREGSKYITSTAEKIKPEGMKKSRFVHKGDFILSNSMSFGRPYILGVDGCIHDGWLVIRDTTQSFDKIYLYYYLSSGYMYGEFKKLAVGGVVNNLNSNLVRGVRVLIPEIEKQQEFAAIEKQIEAQKELVKRSIVETETLFNSRMDFWFN